MFLCMPFAYLSPGSSLHRPSCVCLGTGIPAAAVTVGSASCSPTTLRCHQSLEPPPTSHLLIKTQSGSALLLLLLPIAYRVQVRCCPHCSLIGRGARMQLFFSNHKLWLAARWLACSYWLRLPCRELTPMDLCLTCCLALCPMLDLLPCCCC